MPTHRLALIGYGGMANWHHKNIRDRIPEIEVVCTYDIRPEVAETAASEGIEFRETLDAVLSDPTRLTILSCIRAAGPISVSDLAAATGIADTTVSQTLRHLRATQTVEAERDGRVMRYRLADPAVAGLIDSTRPPSKVRKNPSGAASG